MSQKNECSVISLYIYAGFRLISMISPCADILDFRHYHYPPTPLPSKAFT